MPANETDQAIDSAAFIAELRIFYAAVCSHCHRDTQVNSKWLDKSAAAVLTSALGRKPTKDEVEAVFK